MLNWDDPLTPIGPRAAMLPLEAPVIGADVPPVSVTDAQPGSSLPPLPTAAKPINPEDKRVVNGLADINQLAPFKYPWAWEYFLNANKNHWTPLDVNMTQDVHRLPAQVDPGGAPRL